MFSFFVFVFFFFKPQTAYEMRIIDWSSDVCSSDLTPLPIAPLPPALALSQPGRPHQRRDGLRRAGGARRLRGGARPPGGLLRWRRRLPDERQRDKIGRASCRDSVCKDV